MNIRVRFPGGKRVDAEFDAHVVTTDQPPSAGGAGLAPSPFDLFLVSLATCAGLYVLGFCGARGIPMEGIELVQHARFEPATHRLESVEVEIVLPPTFPEQYRAAVVKAAEACKVKKTLASPPAIAVRTRVQAGSGTPREHHVV